MGGSEAINYNTWEMEDRGREKDRESTREGAAEVEGA